MKPADQGLLSHSCRQHSWLGRRDHLPCENLHSDAISRLGEDQVAGLAAAVMVTVGSAHLVSKSREHLAVSLFTAASRLAQPEEKERLES